jgi:alpha-1,3-glucan synthase
MSQLSKTIKLALKSTEEERAILRARSAVQRFPVIEWRQRMEDFHRLSIKASRYLASHNAWRQSDGTSGGIVAMTEHDDWNAIQLADPPQPDWDVQSAQSGPLVNTPGSPDQWSPGSFSQGNSFLHTPPQMQDGDQNSIFSNTSDTANGAITRVPGCAPDAFLGVPFRPFYAHSAATSMESIASIVDEKADSPLNKVMASVSPTFFSPYRLILQYLQFTDSDGGVVQEFVTKLQNLSADNSKGELSIEKFLQKSEETFYEKVRKDKLSSAASLRSSRRDSTSGMPSPSLYNHPSQPTCTFTYNDTPGLPTDWTQLPTPKPSMI